MGYGVAKIAYRGGKSVVSRLSDTIGTPAIRSTVGDLTGGVGQRLQRAVAGGGNPHGLNGGNILRMSGEGGSGNTQHKRPDLSQLENSLASVFRDFPSNSFKCSECADQAGKIIRDADIDVEILRIENFRIGRLQVQPQTIRAYAPDRKLFTISENAYHELLEFPGGYYLDSLVFEHFGVSPVTWNEYMNLLEAPEAIVKIGNRSPK